MGVINFERAVWPEDASITGQDMEVLARQALWKAGLNYGHGT